MKLKIATYDLFEGAQDSYNRLVDFTKEQKFDVLCLQEINGWQDDDFARLKDFADKAGFIDWEYGNSNSDFKLATFGNTQFTYRTNHAEGFWHCAVEMHLDFDGQELVIVNVDLDPFAEEPRLKEINKLLNKLDLTKPTIITGNLSSLSRQDNYNDEFMSQLEAGGIFKYGREQLDFAVTDRLAEAGLVDMASELGQFELTSPTDYPAGQTPEPPTRTDYFFVSPDLPAKVTNLEVVKNDVTNISSDHYPLALTIDSDQAQTPEPAEKSTDAQEEPEQPQVTTNYDASEGEIDLH